MKWTMLRLNMLPITAVEVQYACETLTNIHNALVDTKNKQELIHVERFNLKPLFTLNQTFLSQSQSSSKSSSLAQTKKKPLQPLQQQPLMTYERLFQQYKMLKQQMHTQVNELKKFYMKNSQDESSCLFHMLRLKLQRCLFDCNFQQDQSKKVMTKAQEEMKYNEIAKNFQSNQSNQSKTKLKSIIQTQQEFVESCQTFKTQNYTGYENQSNDVTKHECFNFQDEQYEELFHQDKVQNKKQSSKTALNFSLEKKKNSASNTKRNSKQGTRKLSTSKTPLKKQPSSQVTIATLNETQLISSERINLDNIQNEQKSEKNIKVLTNKNSSFKNTIKPSENSSGFSKQGQMKQNSTQHFHPLNQKNKNQKMKSYSGLNQKKQEHNKTYTNTLQKQKVITGNQGNKSIEMPKNSFKKQQVTKNSVPKIPNKNKTNHEPDKKDINISTISQSPQQQTLKTADQNDLKEILTSKGSELRFTIKMSREQYKSLLQLKSKMIEKSSS